MKVRILSFVFIFALQTALFSVSTQYLSSSDFKDLSAFKMSNVSLVDGKGFRLSHEHSKIFESSNVIWSLALAGNKMLVSTGERANLVLVDGTQTQSVFFMSNKLMFSEVEAVKGGYLVSALPGAEVFLLDKKFHVKQSWSRTNKYAWDLIPSGKGFYLLCGKPAELYYIKGKKIQKLASFADEENLMQGEMLGGELYFSGEHYLYRWDGQKAVALAYFINSVSGFVVKNDEIYLATSTRNKKLYSGNGNTQRGSHNKSRSSFQKSRLWKISIDGRKRLLFESKNAQFLSISALKNSLILGTDKDGGYYEYNLLNGEKSFSALGEGKILHLFSFKNAVHAVTVYPSSVIRIDEALSKKGTLISIPYDTGNLSQWGKVFVKKKLLPDTALRLYTRTGFVEDPHLWEVWKSVDKGIASSSARYFQYKVVLTGNGKNSPLFRKLTVPYVQKNVAPEISNFKVDYDHLQIKFSWDTKDANKDPLSFVIYIATEEGAWVALTDGPQKGNDFSLNRADFPSGKYRVKLIVSDGWANANVKSALFISDAFYIDNDPPQIGELSLSREGQKYRLRFTVTDALLPIMMTAYTFNGKDWTQLSPVDGIFDSKSESFDVLISVKQAGFLQIHARDLMGNANVRGLFVK